MLISTLIARVKPVSPMCVAKEATTGLLAAAWKIKEVAHTKSLRRVGYVYNSFDTIAIHDVSTLASYLKISFRSLLEFEPPKAYDGVYHRLDTWHGLSWSSSRLRSKWMRNCWLRATTLMVQDCP